MHKYAIHITFITRWMLSDTFLGVSAIKSIRGSKVFQNLDIFGIEFGFRMIWAEMDNILLDLHNSSHNVGSLIQ